MFEYIVVGEFVLPVNTEEECADAQLELQDAGLRRAKVWQAPQASREEAEAAGYEGTRLTTRVLLWGLPLIQ